jgi:hypothetical protein
MLFYLLDPKVVLKSISRQVGNSGVRARAKYDFIP